MKDEMTKDDIHAAAEQGWQIGAVYDTRGYFTRAIVPTSNSPLSTPHDAHQLVWEKAKRGDVLSRKAMSIVVAHEIKHGSKKRK